MVQYTIYGLVDPKTNCVRYVGRTKRTLIVRLRKHITDKPKHNTYKYNWIQSLLKEGLEPEMILLEKCDETNWIDRERYWINYFDNLTNLTTGGEGCDYFSDEVRQKISNKVKKAWENEEYRKKMSINATNYWSNINNRVSHGDKLRNKPITEEHKEKISLGRKDGKPIAVNGVEYRNIKYAVKNIPIHRQTLKRRLTSKKFPEYFYL